MKRRRFRSVAASPMRREGARFDTPQRACHDPPVTTDAPAPERGSNRIYSSSTATWAGILLVVCAAILYASTLDRWLTWGDLAGGDLITHQYAQVQARPSNAPGYPLYTMGGWLWFHGLRGAIAGLGSAHPNPIPILSAYSTLWALVALWLLYRTVCLVTSSRYWPQSPWLRTGNWPLAWLLSAFLGVTYFFWFYATTTEQYSSAVAQTVAIVYVYLLWAEADAEAHADYGPRSSPGRLLILLALLCGISLAHMLTVAFIVPPLIAVVLWQRPNLLRNGRMVAAVVFAAVLPLSAYLYVFVRGAQHPEWWGGEWKTAAAWFWAFVSTAQGREELGWGLESGRAFFGNGFPALTWQELSVPILLAGLVGIAFLQRKTAAMLYGTLAIYALFAWAYRYGNWFQVVLPAYPLILLGVAGLSLRLASWSRTAHSRWAQPALLLLLTAAVGWRFAASVPQTNSRRYPPDEALGHAAVLLADEPPENAALFAEQGDSAALDYLAHIWGLRPDVMIIGSDQAQRALDGGRPLLATWGSASTLIGEMGGPLGVSAENADWARIGADNGPRDVAGDTMSRLRPVGVPELERYTTAPGPASAPITETVPAMDVQLLWRLPEGGWPVGLSLSLRPTLNGAFVAGSDGAVGEIVQIDAAAPLHGLTPFAPNGPLLADAYRLPLPAPLPAGADGIAIVLYRAVDGGFETVADLRLPLNPPGNP